MPEIANGYAGRSHCWRWRDAMWQDTFPPSQQNPQPPQGFLVKFVASSGSPGIVETRIVVDLAHSNTVELHEEVENAADNVRQVGECCLVEKDSRRPHKAQVRPAHDFLDSGRASRFAIGELKLTALVMLALLDQGHVDNIFDLGDQGWKNGVFGSLMGRRRPVQVVTKLQPEWQPRYSAWPVLKEVRQEAPFSTTHISCIALITDKVAFRIAPLAAYVLIEYLPGPPHRHSSLSNIPQEGGEAPTASLRSPDPARPERASNLARLALPERLAAAGNIHLFSKKPVGPGHKPFAYNIYLATLQRMVLGQQRSELAEIVSNIYTGGIAENDLMHKAKELLTDYCNAVRDHDFMAERLKQAQDNDEDDPFEISTRHVLDLCLMKDAGLVPLLQPHCEELFSQATDRSKYKARVNILPSTSRHILDRVTAQHHILSVLGWGWRAELP
ncbi:hypothetical protein N657DRAFT_634221 [Parathielavia appendiculata]|uniref:Uncharacterized protein n=1 Tax=Parathielavia appendiculata TaxID=2587402 RepID=A0AAN6TYQ6_9PEZI|nr:hypothetical protein N657DRAFT_634221 [Parathielavia appendiculata]